MNDFDYELLERCLKLFGFDLDQNPSLKELKSAYRKLIAKNHPDKVGSLDKEIQDVAKKRTQELNEAFEYIEKNYTPKPMSERLQKINEENFDLKQKLNVLEIKLDKIENPDKFKLHQNYPNPFNPITTISFDLPEENNVKLNIYDISGRKISTLSNQKMKKRYHQIKWDGTNDQGKLMSAGVYIYSINAGKFQDTKKMIFIK